MSHKDSKDHEQATQEYERTIRRYELMLNEFSPQYERLVESSTSIIKYFFVMNAGAILALLTFVGNEHIPCLFQQLHFTFKILIVGVISAIGGGIAEFFRQYWELEDFKHRFLNNNWSNVAKNNKIFCSKVTSYACSIVSLLSFVGAITNALRVLTGACR